MFSDLILNLIEADRLWHEELNSERPDYGTLESLMRLRNRAGTDLDTYVEEYIERKINGNG